MGRAYAIGSDPLSIHLGRMRDPKYAYNYERFARAHGGSSKETREAFQSLHPFVRANYGDQVILVGASANTNTGNVRTWSSGVAATNQLDAYLKGSGPLPPEAAASRPAAPMSVKLESLKQQPVDMALSTLLSAGWALLGPEGELAGQPHAESFKTYLALASTIVPTTVKTTVGPGGLAITKEGANGKAVVTYSPGDGMSFRVERGAGGVAVAVSVDPTDSTRLRVSSSALRREDGPRAPRYSPEQEAAWIGIARPVDFLT